MGHVSECDGGRKRIIVVKNIRCTWSGFSRWVFLGKSITKAGRAPVVEFSQNQKCQRPETRTLVWLGRVWFCPCPSSGIWPYLRPSHTISCHKQDSCNPYH